MWVSPGTPAKGVTQDTTAPAAPRPRGGHGQHGGGAAIWPRAPRLNGAAHWDHRAGPATGAGSATRIQGCVTGVIHRGHRGVCLASLRTCANPTPDPPVRWPKVESYIVRAAAAARFRFLFLPVWQKKRCFCISARCCWVSFSPDLSENTSSLQGKTSSLDMIMEMLPLMSLMCV